MIQFFFATLSISIGLAQSGSDWQAEYSSRRPELIADDARRDGDAQRGAIVFFQRQMACSRCHVQDPPDPGVAPDLTRLSAETTDAHLVESILNPSKIIRKEFQVESISTTEGRVIQGFVIAETDTQLTLRETLPGLPNVVLSKSDIEDRTVSAVSSMPAGQIQQLSSRQQFLDLVRYLMELRSGGPQRAQELRPDPRLIAAAPIPEYESHLDHRTLIESWDKESFNRGEAIYLRVCANCHGTHDRQGSLPQSPRFAQAKLRNGSDPLSMYRTLTHGFGFMVPQNWMVPRQKYDVIYYIREAYFKGYQQAYYSSLDADYLSRLPIGDTTGPEPSAIEPWVAMDYGPSMTGTFEIEPGNLAFKGIATRLDFGPGGVSRGRAWQVFDHDTFRMAGFWHGDGFIDWAGIHFDGRHGAHPKISGELMTSNPPGPGWAHPETGSLEDPRPLARDGRPYGPLPRDWVAFRGTYANGPRTVMSYQVGTTSVLETSESLLNAGGLVPESQPNTGSDEDSAPPVMVRHLELGARPKPLTLVVATEPVNSQPLIVRTLNGETDVVSELQQTDSARVLQTQNSDVAAVEPKKSLHAGKRSWVIEGGETLNLDSADFTVTAKLRTTEGGTIFSQAARKGPWVPDAKALFVRDGKLVFDVGWVGAVTSRRTVNDGNWHNVAVTWNHESGEVRLFIDGRRDAQGTLRANKSLADSVIRLGYASENFPEPSQFTGDLSSVAFYSRRLESAELSALQKDDFLPVESNKPLVLWNLENSDSAITEKAGDPPTEAGDSLRAIPSDVALAGHERGSLALGLRATVAGVQWRYDESGRILLDIPSGSDPLRLSLWMTRLMKPDSEDHAEYLKIEETVRQMPEVIPSELTRGGSPRWPEVLTAGIQLGNDQGPFAVDFLNPPTDNPWFAQLRLTGLDFFADSDQMAICSWDGDVWLVTGLRQPKQEMLKWKRIASGLFQPLGLKIVDGRIYLTCRDQLVILNDLNGDLETDYYECFNNDHQVTEHFHEFAMGLQRDAAGNFYYAKSARHALTALVPHHGTLLRVSPDGAKTDIIANGFRAANGVCLNPDGSFIVTDQEGHWNPKNRINWVTLSDDGQPKFYGNMFGYHDRTDEADSAMEPPLCWITNAFDRSPAELLWVESDQWAPLKGSLLNLSYGYGKVFVVPHEHIDGVVQGGMIELPVPTFPTGVMRGRFHPADGQLYLCGMFAWAGNATHPGGFYRIRRTSKPVCLPLELHVATGRLTLRMSEPLDPASLTDIKNIQIEVWDLTRSENYGSPHLNERRLQVRSAGLRSDGVTVDLDVPELSGTWCMSIRYQWKTAEGANVSGLIHNTIHKLADTDKER
ncbi:MAG: c-type cytochrome [Planctomyces sp.]|nr:c-type cytochrome [Planctomyces sp.]